MTESTFRVPFLPKKLTCSIELAVDTLPADVAMALKAGVPNGDSMSDFVAIAQNFVTSLQILWQYAHEVGSVAERTSLTNLANLPSLLKEIEKRRNKAGQEEIPVANIVFSLEGDEETQKEQRSFPVYDLEHAKKLGQCLTQHRKALRLLNETVLQQMVNVWERALGDLVSCKLNADPDAIPKEKTLSYSQVLTFANFEEVRRHVVEEEVADFLKSKTTAEQINYFRRELGADFKSQFAAVDQVCEIVLRRHALVHGGGIASAEYCRRAAKLKNLSIAVPEQGARLAVDAEYIKGAWSIIYAAGVVLIHLVARSQARTKKCKKDEETSDSFLINAAYNAIKSRQYDAAKRILCYAHRLRLATSSSDLMVLVNLAQAHKWTGDNEKCQALISKQDWKSCSANFRLCVAALRNDDEAFWRELDIVARERTVSVSEIFDWPVFQEMRAKDCFLDRLKAAYGEDIKIPTEYKQPKLLEFEPEATTAELLKGIVREMAELPESAIEDEDITTAST